MTQYNHKFYHTTTCTCGPLIYVRTLKCASTFFWHSFNQKFGWEEIYFKNINWEKHVFSHILDPKLRRIKGVTEFIWMNQAQRRLADPNYRTFIQQTPVLDWHTVSYHDNFGDFCNRIDWIPINDRDHQVAVDLTSQMLSEHDIWVYDRWHWPYTHRSEPEKKLLEQQVAQCLSEVATPAVDEYLHQDQLLYQRVVERFNPGQKLWADVTWLRPQ